MTNVDFHVDNRLNDKSQMQLLGLTSLLQKILIFWKHKGKTFGDGTETKGKKKLKTLCKFILFSGTIINRKSITIVQCKGKINVPQCMKAI